MEEHREKFTSEFLRRQETLEQAKKVLKEEFIGIDRIIDEVIDNVSSWYFLPEIQEKPIVVNLWGLTGVGKSSLINRLVQLIDFEDYYYRFDLGEKGGRYSFQDSIEELCVNNESTPIIITLDEIQHSRTVSGPFRQELENDKNRMIWELIDSGRIQFIDWKRGIWSFENFINKLIHLQIAGVEVEKGVVVSNKELYKKEMEISLEEDEVLKFVPESEYDTILSFAGKRLGLNLYKDVENLLLSFSANETVLFLNKVLSIGRRPSIKNFTKALIFVIGNLDEAYTMSNNFSADMDADEFNKMSLKITVPKIKKALKSRFRNEQIARLGNIHIIYPALGRHSYQKIILNELEKYKRNLVNSFDVELEFDNSVNDLIYSEGVYPTQGVRPIYTTIHQLLKSKMSLFYSELFFKNQDVDKMIISFESDHLICQYLESKNMIDECRQKIVTSLGDERKNKRDDYQAITAVHESGHAVLSIVLMKTIPEAIFSTTADVDSQGFVFTKFAWNYISRKEIVPRAAMMLGGYVAEELIFGKENLTAGASSDIDMVTKFLSVMYKEHGMGTIPIKYDVSSGEKNHAYHNNRGIEKQIRELVEEALELAKNTLVEELGLLYALSDHLSDNRVLRRNQLEKLVDKSIKRTVEVIDKGDHLYYRNHLKNKVEKYGELKPENLLFENSICLNKKE